MHFEPEDWEYLPSLAPITSASESQDGIYFGTYDGFIFYDYFGGKFSLEADLNIGLPSRRIYQVYHDNATRSLWVVHEDGISFRFPIDEVWRKVPFTALPDHYLGKRITRVGSNNEGIWVDMDGVYTQLNAFTGGFMRRDIVPPDNSVVWNVSRASFFEPPSLIGWHGGADWMTTTSSFEGPGFLTALPTLSIRDRDDYVWFGTDRGIIFRGDSYTRILEPIATGITPYPVIRLYIDGDCVWFADNPFRRHGGYASREGYFLSYYDEKASSWRHYSALSSEVIRDVGVNELLRVGRSLWLATMNGILVLDTRSDTWRWIGPQAGLRDRAVWDMVLHDKVVFAATNRGIDRIDPGSRRVIPNDSTSVFPLTEVHTLHSANGRLYAGTVGGLYEYNGERSIRWRRVSNLSAISIWSNDKDLFIVANNLVFQRNRADQGFAPLPVPLGGGVKILEIRGFNDYIWLATSQGAIIYDLDESRHYVFDKQEGLPSDVVYATVPTESWVWFLTKEGVVRFNWRPYFE